MTDSTSSLAAATTAVRAHLLELLEGRQAHLSFDAAVEGLPAALRGVQPAHVPYSIWQLVDHIRTAQWDILEFSRDAAHQSPPWPAGYWTLDAAPATDAAWDGALAQIARYRAAFEALLHDPARDLYAPLAHGDGQTLLREALLIADHTAYHVGQIVLLRRLLGAPAG
ncbi:DinB family protein [Hymenobacter sp. PAMC 26628]|uniref:DinB family protein n=1 Tax=Hymenobacter sp. PAMC 26628 TaxID=1484118 RepID=UPI000770259F|nr:DinB family protein [Hymenobacter sp. PAMC 26628]AMJ66049.1 ABC transporter [Hymenobacter sp. PAMC 26628]